MLFSIPVYIGGIGLVCFQLNHPCFCMNRGNTAQSAKNQKQQRQHAQRTRIFFEGLLPEGFTRRCVAEWMHLDENDYLSILSGLGRECLGAVKILDESDKEITPEYRELSAEEVYALASEGATESADLVVKSHLSLTGASGKVGLYFDEENQKWYLPIGDAPSTHIVKQSHVRLKKIVANEQLCLLTARHLGIDVPESFIVTADGGNEETILFATQRYDRKFVEDGRRINGFLVPCRLHQEDFAQALGIAAVEKYEKNHEGYLKKIFTLIWFHSSDPMADALNQAKEELLQQGFSQIEEIREMIMKKDGINHF